MQTGKFQSVGSFGVLQVCVSIISTFRKKNVGKHSENVVSIVHTKFQLKNVPGRIDFNCGELQLENMPWHLKK